MGRFKSKGVIVRELDEITIIFYDSQSIYVYPKKYRTGTIFHRWFAPKGTGEQWQYFRWDLMRLKHLTLLRCYELAASYDIVAVSVDRKLNLEGRKVIYK